MTQVSNETNASFASSFFSFVEEKASSLPPANMTLITGVAFIALALLYSYKNRAREDHLAPPRDPSSLSPAAIALRDRLSTILANDSSLIQGRDFRRLSGEILDLYIQKAIHIIHEENEPEDAKKKTQLQALTDNYMGRASGRNELFNIGQEPFRNMTVNRMSVELPRIFRNFSFNHYSAPTDLLHRAIEWL